MTVEKETPRETEETFLFGPFEITIHSDGTETWEEVVDCE